jgi:phage terminase large subunit GpA-like protein
MVPDLPTTPEAEAGLKAAAIRAQRLWAPPPSITVLEWAERHRVLPKGLSARPGPWVTESYQREILSCITEPLVQRVVLRKSTQVGWSEMLNSIMGYFIDADPSPMLMVQPRESDSKKYSRKRIAPMINSTPSLKAKVRESKSRDGGNTMLMKEFDGGFLTIGSANSGASLRSDHVRVLLLDEADAYPLDVDGEGSPIEIAEHRTETFGDEAKTLIGSTPAKPKGMSVIDKEYAASSQAMFHVPCPACGFMQPLLWRDPKTQLYLLTYEKDERGDVLEDSVRYMCIACKHPIEEKYKQRMLNAGAWVHAFPDRRTVRGFHINALYSPWHPIWFSMAKKWVKAQEDPQKLKSFINLSLAETFDEAGDQIEAHALMARREQYAAEVPRHCCVLIATVDVQAGGAGRLEIQITGFGPGEESWLIAHHQIFGDPGIEETWRELDSWLLESAQFQHECGGVMRPALTLIDSGDHTDSVYDYVMPRQRTRRRVFALKGVDHLTKPGLAEVGSTKRGNIILFTVATYAAKDRIFSRLKITPPEAGKPKPGYMHLPEWVTDEYLEQLTAEKKIPVENKRTRRIHFEYVKTHGRNEALDLTVYAHAGLFIAQRFVDPKQFGDLHALSAKIMSGGLLQAAPPVTRKVRSQGID